MWAVVAVSVCEERAREGIMHYNRRQRKRRAGPSEARSTTSRSCFRSYLCDGKESGRSNLTKQGTTFRRLEEEVNSEHLDNYVWGFYRSDTRLGRACRTGVEARVWLLRLTGPFSGAEQ